MDRQEDLMYSYLDAKMDTMGLKNLQQLAWRWSNYDENKKSSIGER